MSLQPTSQIATYPAATLIFGTHTHSARLPETVTNTHVEHKVALAVSRVHCPHLPEAEKELKQTFTLALCLYPHLQIHFTSFIVGGDNCSFTIDMLCLTY